MLKKHGDSDILICDEGCHGLLKEEDISYEKTFFSYKNVIVIDPGYKGPG